jgi:hypothetical protein
MYRDGREKASGARAPSQALSSRGRRDRWKQEEQKKKKRERIIAMEQKKVASDRAEEAGAQGPRGRREVQARKERPGRTFML